MRYKPSFRRVVCSLLFLLATFLPVALRSQERRPLDPLTPQEKTLAERTALADSRVQKLLGAGKRQLISVELSALKLSQEQDQRAAAGRSPGMHRVAEVIFLRYEGEVGVRALVDLTGKQVTEVTELKSDQVPMTQADVSEAWQLAVKNEQVRQQVGTQVDRFQVQTAGKLAARGAYTVDALRLESTDERDPCAKHRCLRLLLRRGTDYLMKPIIIVDLSTREVRVEEKER